MSYWCLIFIHVILIEITIEFNLGINEGYGVTPPRAQIISAILGCILCRASDEVIAMRGFGMRSRQNMFAMFGCIFWRASDEFKVIRGLCAESLKKTFEILGCIYTDFLNYSVSADYAMCTLLPGCSRPKRPKLWVDNYQFEP